MKLIILVIGIFIAINAVRYLWLYLSWIEDRVDSAAKITFDLFEQMYKICPNKWQFKEWYVLYRSPNKYYAHDFQGDIVEFKTFKDVLKYRRFYAKAEADREEQERADNTKELIDMLQKDIDKYREETQQFIKEHIQKGAKNENKTQINICPNSGGDYRCSDDNNGMLRS